MPVTAALTQLLHDVLTSRVYDVAKVDRRLKELVDAGWFLPEYADAVRADARKAALP